MTAPARTRAQAMDAAENVGRNKSANDTIGDAINVRLDRRGFVKGALGVAAVAAALKSSLAHAVDRLNPGDGPRFRFRDVGTGPAYDHEVAEGYDADVLIRWGDPLLPGAPKFDPARQSAAAQRLQFGYNNDHLRYLPLPDDGNPSRHGLLAVNFEYTSSELMFPGETAPNATPAPEDVVEIEMAAHGGGVIEIERVNGKWRVVENSKYARRIDAHTEIEIAGPAAGHGRMRTASDPAGRRVRGMINNCGGGLTPWGTWLSCEENFHGYFRGRLPKGHRERANFRRYGVGGRWYDWGKWHDRFNVAKEPNEANRFGWVVEIDPFDPTSTPKKRTALGRMKHEGAAGIVNKDGRYVIYMGDDEKFEYVYRFVSSARVQTHDRNANRDILDDGVLSVARFNSDGTVDWLPLIHGRGPLTPANGFDGQADVLIEARRAADLLGATKMDRPEDVETNPRTGKVYVSLTHNRKRTAAQIDAANPRAANEFGHIIEMTPPRGDHAADLYAWEILVTCGSRAPVGVALTSERRERGWLAMPDNLTVDGQGRLWVATDGNSPETGGRGDGLWGVETEGPLRGRSKQFYRVPEGAELTGPCFTPDDETLFVAVQHPGEPDRNAPGQALAAAPQGAWPDFRAGMPPRPSLVAITRRGGGKIAL